MWKFVCSFCGHFDAEENLSFINRTDLVVGFGKEKILVLVSSSTHVFPVMPHMGALMSQSNQLSRSCLSNK